MNKQQRKWFKEIGHPQPLGLGDLVASALQSLGITKLVEARAERTGKPCGCKKRKEALNKIKLPST